MTPTPKPLSNADVDVGILRLPEKAARDFASLMPVPRHAYFRWTWGH
jgi:hypothetical protein